MLSLWMTNCVDIVKAIREARLKALQLFSQKQVLLGVDAENEVDFGFVGWIIENTLRHLVDWCDTGPACYEVDLAGLVRCPGVSFDCRCKCEGVPWNEGVDVGARFAIGVFLDHELDLAFLVWCSFVSISLCPGLGLLLILRSPMGVYGRSTGNQRPSGRDMVRSAAVAC